MLLVLADWQYVTRYWLLGLIWHGLAISAQEKLVLVGGGS